MTVDLLFTVHNRREFTIASFSALVENTNWDHVARMLITDDLSTDGTWEWLIENKHRVPVPIEIERRLFGGPVPAMNYALDNSSASLMAKIDSDVLLCPGWLDIMAGVLEASPGLDALGMEPGFGDPVAPLDTPRTYRPARYIGGVGLFRTRIFKRHRPEMNRRWFGLTRFWEQHAVCGWVTPDLPIPLLDHLPLEPWRTLAEDYVAKGWARQWPTYTTEFEPYWAWWLERKMETAGA